MKSVFFTLLVITSFVYATESPKKSPKVSPRQINKISPREINIDKLIHAQRRENKKSPVFSRVRRQSFGSQDFMNPENDIKFRNDENVTYATLRRNSNGI